MSMEMKKLALAGIVGLAAYGFAGSAAAQTTCGGSSATATDGTWECVEYQDGTSSSYNVITPDQWVGPSDGTFTFTGTSTLNYSFINANCPFTVEGQVQKDSSGNTIGIKVVGASVGGSGTCASISVGGFPWYASDNTTFNNSSRVSGAGTPGDVHPPATGFAEANMGTIEVSVFGSTVCTGYIEDVVFENGNPVSTPSSFTFSGPIVGTACGVSGTVFADTNEDVNAW